jgi:hypothetical protein
VFWPWAASAPLAAMLPLASAYGVLTGMTLLAAARGRTR